MLTEKQGQDLVIKLIELKEKFESTKSLKDKRALEEQQTLCIEKFKYIVLTKTSRYKQFNNYEDLNQEGYVALMMALNNYNPKKGSIFWWMHKYIDTRVSRNANLHTTIRIPLKKAKNFAPKKEFLIPSMIESNMCPDVELETAQLDDAIKNVMDRLTPEQSTIITMMYGLDGSKPLSINKICKKIDKSRQRCLNQAEVALKILKDNIKL